MIKRFILILLLFLVAQSCRSFDNDVFKNSDFYTSLSPNESNLICSKNNSLIATASFKSQSLTDFSIWFSNTFSCGVVFSEQMQGKTFSGEFFNAPELEIISTVAKSLDVEASKVGNTYYIGAYKQEDKGYLVRSVPSISRVDLEKIAAALTSSEGRNMITENCVVMMADRTAVLSKVSFFLDQLSAIKTPRYFISFQLVSLDLESLRESGIDWDISGTILAKTGSAVANSSSSVFNLTAYLKFLDTNSLGSLHSSPSFLALDNMPASFLRGEVVPFPKRNVSPEGTVTESYEEKRVGEQLRVTARHDGPGSVALSLFYSNSSVIDLIGGEVPRTKEMTFENSSVIELDKLCLLGEAVSTDSLESDKNFALFKATNKKSKLQIFCKVIRVGGPVPSLPGPAAAPLKPAP